MGSEAFQESGTKKLKYELRETIDFSLDNEYENEEEKNEMENVITPTRMREITVKGDFVSQSNQHPQLRKASDNAKSDIQLSGTNPNGSIEDLRQDEETEVKFNTDRIENN